MPRGKDPVLVFFSCLLVLLCYKKERHKKDNLRVAEAEPWQGCAEGWRWTKDYAAPRALGEPRGRNWRGRSATGKSTLPARAEGEKRLRSATRNP